MSTMWGIHNDRIPASELLAEKFISVGWAEISDVREIGNDQTALKAALAAANLEAKPGAIPVWAGVLRRRGRAPMSTFAKARGTLASADAASTDRSSRSPLKSIVEGRAVDHTRELQQSHQGARARKNSSANAGLARAH